MQQQKYERVQVVVQATVPVDEYGEEVAFSQLVEARFDGQAEIVKVDEQIRVQD